MAKKIGLADRLNNLNKGKGKDVAPSNIPKPVIQEAKTPAKQGRPTYKKQGMKYDRIFADIPRDLKTKLDVIKVTTFRDECKTQSELIIRALEEFVEKYA